MRGVDASRGVLEGVRDPRGRDSRRRTMSAGLLRDPRGGGTLGAMATPAKRRATYADLHHESKAVAELLAKLSRKGLSVEHYAAQDKPLTVLLPLA